MWAEYGEAIEMTDQFLGSDNKLMIDIKRPGGNETYRADWNPNYFIANLMTVAHWPINATNLASWKLAEELKAHKSLLPQETSDPAMSPAESLAILTKLEDAHVSRGWSSKPGGKNTSVHTNKEDTEKEGEEATGHSQLATRQHSLENFCVCVQFNGHNL